MTARITRGTTTHPTPTSGSHSTTRTGGATPTGTTGRTGRTGHSGTDAVTDPVATTTSRTGGTQGTGGTTAPGTVGALIDGAKDRVYLQLTHLDDATTQHLADAEKRGVDVHLVLTPGQRLDQQEVQRVLLLTDSGVDLKVTKQSGLPDHAGVADGVAFQGKTDPVAHEGPATQDKDPAHVQKQVDGFEALLASKVSTAGKGLQAPGKVTLHPMPDSGSSSILNAINSAKKTIDLEVYQLADRDVVDALKRAAGRGVAVRVMVEPKSLEPSNYDSLSKDLKAAGVSIQPTPPSFDSHRNVDHAKFMVVDNQEMLFGTGNLVRVGLGGNEQNEANNRDFWVEDTQAESVKEGATLFDADWNRTPTTGVKFANLVVTPDDDQPDIFSVIDGAKKSLCVYNQSLSDPDTVQKLLDAKARGVDVKVLLGAFQQFPSSPPANQPAVDKLSAAGIKVEYLTNSYLHAKAVVTEDTAFVGSQNFTDGGMVRNREVGAIYKDPALVKQLTDTFSSDFANPGPQPTTH